MPDPKTTDELDDDFRRFGLSYEADADDEPETGIWAENVEAVRAFLCIASQFRVVAPGDGSIRRTGLDYQGAKAGLRLARVKMTPELWADIQIIEDAVVGASFEDYA